jgi:hypothetical protein
MLGGVGFAVAVVLGACSGATVAPGELVVAIQTDLSIPRNVDTIRLQVISQGVTEYDQSFPVYPGGPAGVKLPATLGVVAGDAGAPVLIRAIAISNHQASILREATVQVPTNRTALMQLPLEWLCQGSASDTDPIDPTTDPIVEATCGPGMTCIAGECAVDAVDSRALPDYSNALVFGGGTPDGGGSCFDTMSCFPTAAAAKVDEANCTVPVPKGATAATINVGLVPTDKEGICNAADCFVTQDMAPPGQTPPDGWTLAGGTIQLPPGVCTQLKKKLISKVVVSTGCPAKTPALPTCGPWNAAGGAKDGGIPDATLPCKVTCGDGGVVSGTHLCECTATCGVDTYSVECGAGSCVCLKNGSPLGSGPIPGTTCQSGYVGCGFPGTPPPAKDSGPADAPMMEAQPMMDSSGDGPTDSGPVCKTKIKPGALTLSSSYYSPPPLPDAGVEAGADAGTTLGTGGYVFAVPASACIDATALCGSGDAGGTLGAAGMGVNLNQAMKGMTAPAKAYSVPPADGAIAYSVSNLPAGGWLEIHIDNGGTDYCFATTTASGTVFLNAFSSACLVPDAGTPEGGGPLPFPVSAKHIEFLVNAPASASPVPYNFCVTGLAFMNTG